MDLFEAKVESAVQERMRKEIQRIADDPDMVIAAYAKKLENAEKAITMIRDEMQPKADFYDAVTASDDWSEMSRVAKLIGIQGWGRTKIFALLRGCKVLRYNNDPYQEFVNRGYFKVVEKPYSNPKTGETEIAYKTVVSQKGIDFIRKTIIGEFDDE